MKLIWDYVDFFSFIVIIIIIFEDVWVMLHALPILVSD